jgi:uncharacterized membrane protein YczE
MLNRNRVLLYCAGVVIMSLGLALNVKCYLGVAPILTIPRVLSQMTGWEFSNMLFAFYALFIGMQFLLLRKKFRVFDLIQFPIGLGITRLVALFTRLIPTSEQSPIVIKIIILAMAIIVTGIGVALSVDMKIAPNPADGLAAAVGEVIGKGLGMGKNIVDISSVVVAFVISMIHFHSLGPIGFGTLAAGLLVGRVIALFNKICLKKLEMISGMTE